MTFCFIPVFNGLCWIVKIFEIVLENEEEFLVLNKTSSSPLLLTPINQLLMSNRAQIVNIAQFIHHADNPQIPLLSVRILRLLCMRQVFNSFSSLISCVFLWRWQSLWILTIGQTKSISECFLGSWTTKKSYCRLRRETRNRWGFLVIRKYIPFLIFLSMNFSLLSIKDFSRCRIYSMFVSFSLLELEPEDESVQVNPQEVDVECVVFLLPF
jgi:hypothetical protein